MPKVKFRHFTGAALVFGFSLFSSPSHSSEICFVNTSGVNIEAKWVTLAGRGVATLSGGYLRPGGNAACITLSTSPLSLAKSPMGIYRVVGPNFEVGPMQSQFPMPNGQMYNTWLEYKDGLWSPGNGAITAFNPIVGPVDVYLGGDVNAMGYAGNLPRFVGMGLGVYGVRAVVLDGPQKGGDGVYRLFFRDIPWVTKIIPNPALDPNYTGK